MRLRREETVLRRQKLFKQRKKSGKSDTFAVHSK
jgi:hypothetical protein